jgi:hypothetical protein
MKQLTFLRLPRKMQLDGRSGQKAVLTGQQAENLIFEILKMRELDALRQVSVGTSIYGHPLVCDFLVQGLQDFPDGLIIESKWQGSSGSVDEKFPYLERNIVQRYPCPAIVVVCGGGAKPGAIKWLKAQVNGQKLVGVYTLEEFMVWAISNL